MRPAVDALISDLKIIKKRQNDRDEDGHRECFRAKSKPNPEKHGEKVKRIPA